VMVHSYAHMNINFRGENNSQLLPDETDPDVRTRHAQVIVNFYAALFGSVKDTYMNLTSLFMQNALNGIEPYVAIQKRHFEQQCVRYMFHLFNYSDFSEKDFDKRAPEWQYLLKEEKRLQYTTQFYSPGYNVMLSDDISNFHPLCNMTAGVVLGAQVAHGLSDVSTYVLLTDKQEPVPPDLLALPVIIPTHNNTSVTLLNKKKKTANDEEDMLVDILLGLHSALLVRNPYSTLTLPLEILRVILNLPTSSIDRSSNISLTLQGNWLTMSDVCEALGDDRGYT